MKNRFKILSILLCSCIFSTIFSSCVKKQSKEGDDLSAIDTRASLPFTKSEQIRLTELEYKPRNDYDKSKISLNSAFPSGYEIKKSIFIHPSSVSLFNFVDFTIDLTGYPETSLIILEYYVGIADGAMADGIEFVSMVNDKKVMSVISKENKWIRQTADISNHAGETIKLSLGTKGSPTINSAWAAFGDPVINAIENNTNFLVSGNGEEITTIITGDLTSGKNGYLGKGGIKIESSDFSKGDSYVVVTGKGNPSIQGSTNNKKLISFKGLGFSDAKFQYIIPVDSSIQKRSDWDVALGLPTDQITPIPYDRNPPSPKAFVLEMSQDTEYVIEKIEVWRKPGIIKVESFINGAYQEHDSKDTLINIDFKNSGTGTLLETDGQGILVECLDAKGRKIIDFGKRIPDMAIGSEYFFSFNAGKLKSGEYTFDLFLIDSRGKTKIGEHKTIIKNTDIAMNSEKSGNVTLENETMKIVFVKEKNLCQEIYFYEKKGASLLGSFANPRLDTVEESLLIQGFEFKEQTSTKVILSSGTGSGEVLATYEITGDSLNIIHSLYAAKDFDMLAFDGPRVLCGDGSFGRVHDSAIFAGIDYLSTESSNNTLAGTKPESDRFAPNPKKVTTPVMTLAKDGTVIIYSWAPQKEWAKNYAMPMALFEAPALDGSNYSVMGIYAPSGSQFIKENTLIADNPMPVKKGDSIILEANVKITKSHMAVEGLVNYLQGTGLPEPQKLNKEPVDVFRAMIKGYKAELVENKGWISFLGAGKTPSVSTDSIQAIIASQHLLSDAESKVASEILDKIPIPNPDFEWSYGDSIFFRMQKDYVDAYYSSGKNNIQSQLGRQKDDGTWSYTPNSPSGLLFGRVGDVTMGTVAVPAIYLVKAARLTGNQEAIDGAKLAVKALSKFTKPAGAGPWELPNTNPDILAAFLGLKASIDLFEYTKDPEVLAIAVGIAKQALPFIYFSQIPRKPISLYTSIASFGATNWGRMWQGSPVQWEGLFLAEELKKLSKYDETLDWGKIGTGLTTAGINLVNNDRQPGRFPDYIDLFKSNATIYNIWATTTAQTVYTDLGYSPGWDERTINGVRVISGYEIKNLEVDDKTVKINAWIPFGMPCYFILHTKNIDGITVNGQKFQESIGVLDDRQYGYRKMQSEDAYVIKVKGVVQETEVTVTIH